MVGLYAKLLSGMSQFPLVRLHTKRQLRGLFMELKVLDEMFLPR